MADTLLPNNPTLDDIKKFISSLTDIEVSMSTAINTLYITSLTSRIQQGE